MLNQTKFLKTAMLKFRNAIAKEWVAEMNFIYSDDLILRVWFDHTVKPSGFMHRWCTVEKLPLQKAKKVEDELGRFVANECEDYPKIIAALKKALVKKPDELIDNVTFDIGTDDEYIEESISPIERLEFTYTVKSFCELIGIK